MLLLHIDIPAYSFLTSYLFKCKMTHTKLTILTIFQFSTLSDFHKFMSGINESLYFSFLRLRLLLLIPLPKHLSENIFQISPTHWCLYCLRFIEAIMGLIIYSAMTSKDLSSSGTIFPFYLALPLSWVIRVHMNDLSHIISSLPPKSHWTSLPFITNHLFQNLTRSC